MSKTILLLVALFAATALAHPECHNATGTCHNHGVFECADGTMVPWKARCDGVEQCKDATDELMCEDADRTPYHLRRSHEREQHALINCGGKCNCLVTSINVGSTSTWWKFALNAPRASTLPANCVQANTQTITLQMFKKTNLCRGYICCAKASGCTCTTGHSGTYCQI